MVFEYSYLGLLLLLVPAAVVIAFISFFRKRKRLECFVNKALWQELAGSISYSRRFWKAFLIVTALFFMIISLMRPQYGTKLTTVARKGQDIVIVLDTSLSMLAQDIKPSRLEQAKKEIRGLIETIKGDRAGLVVFSGDALVQCPLTLDYNALQLFLDDIGPGMTAKQGTNLSTALDMASRMFDKKAKQYKVMVVFSDGEYFGRDPVSKAKTLAKEGVHIYTIGIGTKNGDPIPVLDDEGKVAEYKRDEQGNIVLSQLNESILKQIAVSTKAEFFMSSADESVIDDLYSEISKLERKDIEQQLYKTHEDRYQIPLFIVLALLFIDLLIPERKKKHSVWHGRISILIAMFLFFGSNLYAATLSEYFQAKKGIDYLNQGKSAEAEQVFSDLLSKGALHPKVYYNLANAYYENGEMDKAKAAYLEALDKLDDQYQPDLLYNLANVHYNQNDYQNALKLYKRVLEVRPGDIPAKKNLELTQMRLKEQEKTAGGEDKEKQDKKPSGQQQKQEEEQKQAQEKQDQQQKDQGKQEQQKQELQKQLEKARSEHLKKQEQERQQAESILNRLEKKENEARKKYFKKQILEDLEVEHDW
ncbi:VWA domain-containing protein [Thermoproteota archaeon]